MWDVIWTDPDKELVGEHRARKEKEVLVDQKRKHSAGSVRSSVSTASSRRSSADSPFSVFRTRCLRRINTSASNALMASSASSAVESSSVISARSPLSRAFDDDSSHRASIGLFGRRMDMDMDRDRDRDIDSPDKTKESDGKLSLSLSNNDYIFSASPVGDVTISSSVNDDDMTDAERMKSLIQVLGQSSIADGESTGTKKRCADGPLTPPMSPTKATRSSLPSLAKSKIESPSVLVPPIKSPLRLVAPKWHLPMMPNDPDAWKPPNQWDPASSILDDQNAAPLLASSSHSGRGVPQDSDSLQAEVLRMASASTPDTLSRLTELWDRTAHWKLQSLLDSGDDVMMEKRRWMLSALHHMDRIPESTSRRPTPCSQSPMTARMVLALYESSVTVTYLAALYPTKQLYHISAASATSYEEFCNIRTIYVSSVSPTDFPVAPRLFESVHSLLLPSLCTQATLPGILKNVYKCLKTGGAFQLTLIDPLPRAGTMGRRMRAWLENHLLRNLAKERRCMSPSTQFPPLLGEAGLRGEGSTLTSTKFYAMPESATSQESDADCGTQGLREEREAKAQVRSLIGRMLWVEVWGPYVTASKWWWDVPACVEECLELGTFWEYHAIKGVKG